MSSTHYQGKTEIKRHRRMGAHKAKTKAKAHLSRVKPFGGVACGIGFRPLVPLEVSVPLRQSPVYCPRWDLHLRSTTVCPVGSTLVKPFGGVAFVLALWAPILRWRLISVVPWSRVFASLVCWLSADRASRGWGGAFPPSYGA